MRSMSPLYSPLIVFAHGAAPICVRTFASASNPSVKCVRINCAVASESWPTCFIAVASSCMRRASSNNCSRSSSMGDTTRPKPIATKSACERVAASGAIHPPWLPPK
jgi:hypothetical protein